MTKTQLDMIGVVASDLPKTLAFYRTLGLDIPEGAEQQPHFEVTLPGGIRLAWDNLEVIRSMEPDWKPSAPGSGPSLAFLCETPADVDAMYATLTGQGHPGHLEPWDAPWGQRYAVIFDPDGTAIDLFAPLG